MIYNEYYNKAFVAIRKKNKLLELKRLDAYLSNLIKKCQKSFLQGTGSYNPRDGASVESSLLDISSCTEIDIVNFRRKECYYFLFFQKITGGFSPTYYSEVSSKAAKVCQFFTNELDKRYPSKKDVVYNWGQLKPGGIRYTPFKDEYMPYYLENCRKIFT
jgi:hypothetical protein